MRKVILRKNSEGLILLLISVIILTGCSSSHTSDSEIKLDEYRWAVYLTKHIDNGSWLPSKNSGYVAFVREDGSSDLVRHQGMQSGGISWTDQGVYYADEKSDHWITAHGASTVIEKRVDIMDGLVTLSDGVTRVSVYNGGFTEKGYREQVVLSRPGASELQQLDTVGFYPLVSACGDSVYGAYSKRNETGKTNFYFDQIVKDGSIDHTTLFTSEVSISELAFHSKDSPCLDGKVYFLGSVILYDYDVNIGDKKLDPYFKVESDSKYVQVLVTVDTANQSLNWVPLMTETGESLALTDSEFVEGFLDAKSFTDSGKILWMAGNGNLFETDPTTGVTRVLSNFLHHSDNATEIQKMYSVSSVKDTISVIEIDYSDLVDGPHLVEFDKGTGNVLRDVRIKGMKEIFKEGMDIEDIAVKPYA